MTTRYFKSMKELSFFLNRLKMEMCPHCKETGFLNKHDSIKGNREDGNRNDAIKGKRVFCNNRYRRNGCGRTFRLLLADFISHSSITTASLWHLVKSVTKGISAYKIFLFWVTFFSLPTLYRLIKTFTLRQSKIRTLLKTIMPPSDLNCTTPLQQTVRHLQACFPGSTNPISAFQIHFQDSIF
jgi:hypothetical protein